MIENLEQQGIAATKRFIHVSAELVKEIINRIESATSNEKKLTSLLVIYGINKKYNTEQKNGPNMAGQVFNAAMALASDYIGHADDLTPVQREFVEAVGDLAMITMAHELMSSLEPTTNEGVKH